MWVCVFLCGTKLLSLAESFCFVSLPHPVPVSGVMKDANVTQRHRANMASPVTLQVLSNDVLLIEKVKRKTFVLKILSIVNFGLPFRPRLRARLNSERFSFYIIKRKFKFLPSI